jgi:DNA-binding response OmpR family regulator
MVETKKKKILIVDSDEFLKNTYANRFRAENFEVQTASNGEEAWNLMEKGFIPDVLFTATAMPKLDGFELAKKMKMDPRFTTIPIAISSHKGEQSERENSIWIGVNDFIIRGVVPLIEVVRRIKLIVGISPTFYLKLHIDELDSLPLAELLDREQQSSFTSDKTKELFLKIEPMKEGGEFKIELTNKKPAEKEFRYGTGS